MISFILKFITTCNKNQSPFDKNYRSGYKNLWINDIKDYKP